MNYGFDLLSLQLKDLAKSFNNNDKSKFNIEKANTKMDCHDITITNENDTIGNLLTTYLLDNKNVEYASYKIPHPLHNKLLLRIKCNKNTIDEIIKTIDKTIKIIVNLINTMKIDWNKFYKGSPKKNNKVNNQSENENEESENENEESENEEKNKNIYNQINKELEDEKESKKNMNIYDQIDEELKNYENND